MSKCVFNCCQNHKFQHPVKPGIFFIPFTRVARPIRNQWISIVAREKCNPNFKPNPQSLMCSEHFAPYEISNGQLSCTAIPTINIGPHNDTVLIPDEENTISNYNDIVCIIENQISAEPTNTETNVEQEIDLEDKIQWSLVGTSKHFDGLISIDGKSTEQLDTQNHPITEVRETILDDDVVIIEEAEEEKIQYQDNIKPENDNQFKDEYSQFLKSYDRTRDLLNKLRTKGKRRNYSNLISTLTAPEKYFKSTQTALASTSQFTKTRGSTTPQNVKRSQKTSSPPKQLATTSQSATTPGFATSTNNVTSSHSQTQIDTLSECTITPVFATIPQNSASQDVITLNNLSAPQSQSTPQFIIAHQNVTDLLNPSKPQSQATPQFVIAPQNTTIQQNHATPQFMIVAPQNTTIQENQSTPQFLTAPQNATTLLDPLPPQNQLPPKFMIVKQIATGSQNPSTSQFMIEPQNATTSQFVIAPQNATSPQFLVSPQNITEPQFMLTRNPVKAQFVNAAEDKTTQLVTLIPSTFRVGDMQHGSLYVKDSNTQVYYLTDSVHASRKFYLE